MRFFAKSVISTFAVRPVIREMLNHVNISVNLLKTIVLYKQRDTKA